MQCEWGFSMWVEIISARASSDYRKTWEKRGNTDAAGSHWLIRCLCRSGSLSGHNVQCATQDYNISSFVRKGIMKTQPLEQAPSQWLRREVCVVERKRMTSRGGHTWGEGGRTESQSTRNVGPCKIWRLRRVMSKQITDRQPRRKKQGGGETTAGAQGLPQLAAVDQNFCKG